MSKQLQLRRGTTVQNDAFTGAMGELTLNTDNGEIRVHDGTTQGGAEFIDAVVAFQKPTADNGYTWYRKYASGWVEQGGIITMEFSSGGTNTPVTLPVTMSDANYTISATLGNKYGNKYLGTALATTTNFYVCGLASVSDTGPCYWEVKGIAA